MMHWISGAKGRMRLMLLLLALLHTHVKGWYIDPNQPLSKINTYAARVELDSTAAITASPKLLGMQGKTAEVVTVTFKRGSGASATDWIGVFSPGDFNASVCTGDEHGVNKDIPPLLCSSPIKYKYANFSSPDYVSTGVGSVTFRLINQRADFAFALFKGDLNQPILLAVSNKVSFADPKAPVYPRLALGSIWNEMTITWTSGYGSYDAIPIVEWGIFDQNIRTISPALTRSYSQDDMCGPPASTVGWRDPGYIHTAYLKELWPDNKYVYRVGHKLKIGSYIWGAQHQFNSGPYPGEDSLQRVIIFGDMGKGERDGSNEYNDYQPGALNTTDRLIEDLGNFDLVFHIGDITYANGYLSEWDQFTEQVEAITCCVPYMIGSGNHERDWPNSGSFYNTSDSGGECGVPAENTYVVPTINKDNFWYRLDYGLFKFCIADSEKDWRPGTEQYAFIEECLADVDRQKQPWLIFIAHRVLGYSSTTYYAAEGSFAEPMGRESLQPLWQKYKVDLAFYGHAHVYERTCPVYENQCTSEEKDHYSGTFNATIHLTVGGGGAHLGSFASQQTLWSLHRDTDWGFTKLTAFNHSTLLFEYKRSRDGKVYDQFWISREYKDVLGCDALKNCPPITLAT